jgi:hypothetical protein
MTTGVRYRLDENKLTVCTFIIHLCKKKKKGKAIPLHAMEALGAEKV